MTVGRATLFVALAALCFGAIPIFVTLATQGGTPLFAVLAVRYLCATALLLAVARSEAAIPVRRWLTIAFLGGAGQAVISFLSLSALRYVTAATLSFLFYTFPAWVTLFAVLRGRERVSAVRLAALGSALLGVAVMVGAPGTSGMRIEGVALALSSAVLYALYIPLINRLQSGVAPAAASGYIALGAGVIFAAVSAAGGTGVGAVTAAGWVYGLALAVVSTALAFILFLRGLAVLGPVRTAITSTVEPFCTAALGALVLGQPLTAGTLAGGVLVALAVYLLNRPAKAETSATIAEA